jgi:FkbM family methyltransferase
MRNSLNENMSTEGLDSLVLIYTLYHEFFLRHDYDWWYKVQPGDIVVDIGSCIGFFTCHAFDRGASKVYAVEPNRNLVNTILKNASQHIVNKDPSPLTIVNAAIGSDSNYLKNIHGKVNDSTFNIITFKQFLETYKIDYIDYLKVDCEGGEYNIFTAENFDFIKNKVKHISLEVHLDCFKEAPQMFLDFRNNFLSRFDKNKIKFLEDDGYKKTFETDWKSNNWPIGWGSSWMIYICNH